MIVTSRAGGRRGVKKLDGMTLVELLIAIMVMGIIVGPLLLFMLSAARQNVLLRDRTVASFTAQLRMEELIGMPWEELSGEIGNAEYNGLQVGVSAVRRGDYSDLADVVVTVFGEQGIVLCEYENIIHVGDAQ